MKGNLKKAEHYYVEAKMWTSAMSMYRQLEKWEEGPIGQSGQLMKSVTA